MYAHTHRRNTHCAKWCPPPKMTVSILTKRLSQNTLLKKAIGTADSIHIPSLLLIHIVHKSLSNENSKLVLKIVIVVIVVIS